MQRSLRILRVAAYYEPAFCYGGPAVSVPAACKALVRAGDDVTVFTTTANGDSELDVDPGAEIDRDGVKVHYFPRERPLGYFRSSALAQALGERAREFDVLHLHGIFCDTNRVASRIARRRAVPYLATAHGTLYPVVLRQKRVKKAVYMSLIERRVLAGAARIVALSEIERGQIERLGLRAPVEVIPNGLDPRLYADLPPREHVDEFLPALEGRPYALFLSRLHPKKAVEHLIEAFAPVARRNPEWRLVVAGPEDYPGYGEKLSLLIQSRGLESAVLVPGPAYGELKLALLGGAELFCLPSHSEGQPTAAIEAMLCGLPVLISDGCYLPEVAREQAGIVVPTDAEAISAGLQELIDAGEGRRAIGARGRAFARRAYGADAIAERTRRLYREVCAEQTQRG